MNKAYRGRRKWWQRCQKSTEDSERDSFWISIETREKKKVYCHCRAGAVRFYITFYRF